VAESNIGSGERQKRLMLGVAAMAAGLGVGLFGAMSSVYWWVLLFLLFWAAGLGLFQAKEKT
jgi:hypothetical protein